MKFKEMYRYRSVWMGLAILWVMFFLSMAFWKDTRMVVMMTRLPIYLAGMIAGWIQENPITKKEFCYWQWPLE